jgi:hypothetical protein
MVLAQPQHPERDGFQVTNKVFTNPSNTIDQIKKRQITICNLFANHQLTIPDIVRVLDETYEHVVRVLIEQGYVHERRKLPREPVQLQRNRGGGRMIY